MEGQHGWTLRRCSTCGPTVLLRPGGPSGERAPRAEPAGRRGGARLGRPARRAAGQDRTWNLPFRWVSDPDGSRLARPLDAWNAEERGGLFHPLVLLVAPDGTRLVEHRSRDFADRDDDEDVLAALRDLGLPPRTEPAQWQPDLEPEPTPQAFRSEAYGPCFRGIRFAGRALAGRMRDEQDAEELRATQRMAESFLDAWKQRSASAGSG